MDADGVQQDVDGQTGFDSSSKALNDFASDWTDVMQANDLLVTTAECNRLQVTITNALLRHEELCGLVVGVINLNVVFTELSNGIFLAQANASVFSWRENGCRNISVVHLLFGATVQTASQQTTSVNGNRCKRKWNL